MSYRVEVKGRTIKSAYLVTPSDTVDLPNGITAGVYVGGSGTLVCTLADGMDITFTALQAGVVHPIAVKRIKTTSGATTILALY